MNRLRYIMRSKHMLDSVADILTPLAHLAAAQPSHCETHRHAMPDFGRAIGSRPLGLL